MFRYLSEELHYVDKTKVALVGEDEGGYTAGMVYLADIEAAGSEPTLTKCVVYVSPTVNWKLTGNMGGFMLSFTSKLTGFIK